MNPRIKELAREAGITTNLDTYYFERDMNKWVDYYSEKFAELIVRECADWIKNTDSDPDIGEEDAKALLEHFGVTE